MNSDSLRLPQANRSVRGPFFERRRLLEPTGPETYAFVDTAIGPLVARVAGIVPSKVGDSVHLDWSASQAHLFDATTQRRIAA